VVLADAGPDDWVLCQITSNSYGDPDAIGIRNESFTQGSLRIISFARPGKLFTASSGLMLGEVGMPRADVAGQIINAIIELLRHSVEKRGTQNEPTG
jgi:mRNA interferase MazF